MSVFDTSQLKSMDYNELKHLVALISSIGLARMNSDLDDEEKKKLGHSIDDLIVSCYFNNQACTSEDFSWTFDTNYGNCYVFNSGFNISTGEKIPPKNSFISDLNYGLMLEMYSGFYENLTYVNSYDSGAGLVVRIENGSYLENDLDGVKVSSGFQTDINIHREFESYLGKPFSDCDLPNDDRKNFDSDLYELIYHSGYQYNQHICLVQCFQKLSLKNCNCTSANLFSLYENSSICKTETDLACNQAAFEHEFMTNDYIHLECLPLCPLECNSTRIKYYVSSFQLISDVYVNYINQTPSLRNDFVTRPIVPDVVKNSIAIVNVFYGSLSYTESTETPKMDVIALFGAIGGNIGLFLGVSLFTIGELITLFLEMYFIFKKNV